MAKRTPAQGGGNRARTPQQIEQSRLQREAAQRETQVQRQIKTAAAIAPSSLRESFGDLASIDILERRMENPDADMVLPIRLKDEPAAATDPLGLNRRWYLRWFNTSLPNRFHSATAQLGYVPVLWTELQDREQVTNAHAGSDQVRRGDRGVEVLCKIPMAAYRKIKAVQQAKRERGMTPKALREQVAAAAIKQGLDPERDESVGGIVGSIKVGRDRLISEEDAL